MAQFSDCLKIAKYWSLVFQKPSIGVAAIQVGLCFFEHNERLVGAIRKVCPDFKPQTEFCLLGPHIVAAYEREPQIPLDDHASKLRTEIESANFADITLNYLDKSQPTQTEIRILQVAVKGKERLAHLFSNESELTVANAFYDTVYLSLVRAKPFNASERIEWPASKPSSEENTASIPTMQDSLNREVIDQPLATALLIREFQARELGLSSDDCPAIFVLIGPRTCGKYLLSQALARRLDHRPVLALNMATYKSQEEGFGLTGLRRGWSDAHAGTLTEFVFDNPNAIIIFRDIDQAHPSVQNLLVPLFVSGTLVDEFGFGGGANKQNLAQRTVSFKKSIIIFITTIGERIYDRADYLKLYSQNPSKLISLLSAEIGHQNKNVVTVDDFTLAAKPVSQLIHYLGDARILPFRSLGIEALLSITRKNIDNMQGRFGQKKIEIVIPNVEALALTLCLSHGPEINPLNLNRAASDVLLNAYLESLNAANSVAPDSVEITVNDERGLLDELRCRADQLLSNLFRRSELLSFDVETVRETSKLQVRLINLRLERVPVSSDYGSDGGISIEVPELRFTDIVGHTVIKRKLGEIIGLLRESLNGTKAGLNLPKGMLLHGAPGTGKTMLAKALAAEVNVPFISVSGAALLDIRFTKKVFARARKFAPCIIFIDEIDALGVRGSGGHDECINQLLVEVDGFDENGTAAIFVVAATNFVAKVDPALTRSGRIDLNVEVPLLDRLARRHFIESIALQLPVEDNFDVELVSSLSAGMSGADLEKLKREVTLDLIFRRREKLATTELLEMLNGIKHGERHANPRLQEQLESTAFHEAGHAVISMALNPKAAIEQVTIVSRRDSLGFTALDLESTSEGVFNRSKAMSLICVFLAGRIAQLKKFPAIHLDGGIDAGAASDLAKATQIAWAAVARWGLDEDFGWISVEGFGQAAPNVLNDKLATQIKHWLDEAKKLTEQAVDRYWLQIDAVAKHLLEHEMIDGESLRKLIVLDLVS